MKPSRCSIIIIYNTAGAPASRRNESASERATATAAAQAAKALAATGFRVTLMPVRNRIQEVIDKLRHRRPDMIVNLCEGFRGYAAFEAQVAGLLELMGIPFTGNPSQALCMCQDKFRAKAVLNAWGLPTPRGWLVKTAGDMPRGTTRSLIVKPNAEDAGIGIGPHSVVRNQTALHRQIMRLVKRYKKPALIEEYIDGREFSVAVVEDTAFKTLPVSEIIFRDLPRTRPRIVGYEAKWNESSAWYRQTLPVCPAHVSSRLAEKLRQLGIEACAALQVRGYARVDFRVDRRGRPFILEVNPNPDPSPEAGLARALAAAGISYEAFWEQQVRLTMKKRKRKGRL